MTQPAPRRKDLCPQCRVRSEHKRITVSDTIALSWCENCRVPRLEASPAPALVEDAPRPAPVEARVARVRAPHQWRWFSVAAPPNTR